MPKISPKEIDIFTRYIYDITSIVIQPGKTYLLESRLQPLLKENNAKTYSDLYLKAKGDSSGAIQKKIIDAITTNETFFFRDKTPFELLQNKILPDLIDRRSRVFPGSKIPLRIWSAACSTGQEVYSIAMVLSEMLDLTKYDLYILGTDISPQAVSTASYGKYNSFDLQRGLPPKSLQKYFAPAGSGYSRVRDELRAMVKFEKVNLLQNLSHLGPFDIIFCRNVAIYFSKSDKVKLFNNLARLLRPDGSFLVGGSETLTNISTRFVPKRYLRGIYYQLKDYTEEALSAPAAMPKAIQRVQPAKPMHVPPPLSTGSIAFTNKPKPSPPTRRPVRPAAPPQAPPAPKVAPPPKPQKSTPSFVEQAPDFAASDLMQQKGSLLQGLGDNQSGQGGSLLSNVGAKKTQSAKVRVTQPQEPKKSLLDRIREKKEQSASDTSEENEE